MIETFKFLLLISESAITMKKANIMRCTGCLNGITKISLSFRKTALITKKRNAGKRIAIERRNPPAVNGTKIKKTVENIANIEKATAIGYAGPSIQTPAKNSRPKIEKNVFDILCIIVVSIKSFFQ